MSKIAKKYLSIMPSSAPAERVFSQVKLVEARHVKFTPQRVEGNTLLRANTSILRLCDIKMNDEMLDTLSVIDHDKVVDEIDE